MPVDADSGQHDVSGAYIIELSRDQFVVCQPIMMLDDGADWGGLTIAQIQSFIDANPLRAARLPGRPLKSDDFRNGPGHNVH